MGIYAVEPLSQESLELLRQLQSLKLIRMHLLDEHSELNRADNLSPLPDPSSGKRGKRLRRLSPETTRKWLEHLEKTQQEWDRI